MAQSREQTRRDINTAYKQLYDVLEYAEGENLDPQRMEMKNVLDGFLGKVHLAEYREGIERLNDHDYYEYSLVLRELFRQLTSGITPLQMIYDQGGHPAFDRLMGKVDDEQNYRMLNALWTGKDSILDKNDDGINEIERPSHTPLPDTGPGDWLLKKVVSGEWKEGEIMENWRYIGGGRFEAMEGFSILKLFGPNWDKISNTSDDTWNDRNMQVGFVVGVKGTEFMRKIPLPRPAGLSDLPVLMPDSSFGPQGKDRNPIPIEHQDDWGEIDFEFLGGVEGGQWLTGYVPNDNGNVRDISGITIATGFDIGQHNAGDLDRIFRNVDGGEELIRLFTPFMYPNNAGQHDSEFVMRLWYDNYTSNHPLRINEEQAHLVDVAVRTDKVNTVKRIFIEETGGNFFVLPEQAQTVLFSLGFQGIYDEQKNIFRLVGRGDYAGAIAALRELARTTGYTARRNAEADHLMPLLNRATAGTGRND